MHHAMAISLAMVLLLHSPKTSPLTSDIFLYWMNKQWINTNSIQSGKEIQYFESIGDNPIIYDITYFS